MLALYQPDSGFVESENAILAHVGLAAASGAEIKVDCPLLDYAPTADGGVRVRTPAGEFTAGALILSVGAWIGRLAPSIGRIFRPVRQTIAFLNPVNRSTLTPDKLPGFTFLADDGHYYGFPLSDHPGVKIGGPHLSRAAIDPDQPDRSHLPEQLALIRNFAARHVPDAAGEPMTLGRLHLYLGRG